jgi:hypothetical protein
MFCYLLLNNCLKLRDKVTKFSRKIEPVNFIRAIQLKVGKSSVFGIFALKTRYFLYLLWLRLFFLLLHCSYQFTTAITDKLYFSNAVVRLKDFNGHIYFPFFAALSLASKYSTYSLMLRLVSLALFLMSLWTLSVTVMHLYPFRGKNVQLLLCTLPYD